MEYIGYILVTNKDEFDSMQIPLDKLGQKKFQNRKIVVTRDGIQSIPTIIQNLLSGKAGLLTQDERNIIQQQIIEDKKLQQPKGQKINNDKESFAINALDTLLQTEKYMDKHHLLEHRITDVAYGFKGANLYVADQVKTAYAKLNQVNFSVKVGEMIKILEKDMSLTCIVMKEDKVDVVWFFQGNNAIDALNKFDKNKVLQPTCHSVLKSENTFSVAMNDSMFRYNVGKSEQEIERLLQNKFMFVRLGVKHSIQYLNEDDTQIMCPFHRIEHQSFAMTRDACELINVNVKKYHEDNYGPVDFRMHGRIKIQDKSYKKHFVMRPRGRLPYNPDAFDIFQLSNLKTCEIYAIPMRTLVNDIVTSTFPQETLMKTDTVRKI